MQRSNMVCPNNNADEPIASKSNTELMDTLLRKLQHIRMTVCWSLASMLTLTQQIELRWTCGSYCGIYYIYNPSLQEASNTFHTTSIIRGSRTFFLTLTWQFESLWNFYPHPRLASLCHKRVMRRMNLPTSGIGKQRSRRTRMFRCMQRRLVSCKHNLEWRYRADGNIKWKWIIHSMIFFHEYWPRNISAWLSVQYKNLNRIAFGKEFHNF